MSSQEIDVRLEDTALLAALLQGGALPGEADSAEASSSFVDASVDAGEARDLLAEESGELQDVSRRISGQYAEVLARFAARAFAGGAQRAAVEQVKASIDSLARLTEVSGDHAQLELLHQLQAIVHDLQESHSRKRAHQRALVRLRAWVPAFAETLLPEDGERLRRLVEWDKGEAPLLDELSNLRGIGPKRLGRLYAAGLFTVEVVANADGDDVAAVTGLPRALSHDVVVATKDYADRERRRCVRILHERSMRLTHIVRSTHLPADGALRDEVIAALREVQDAFLHLTREEEP